MTVMHVEHNKGKRVPALLTLYWSLLLCVDVVRLRTFILKDQVWRTVVACLHLLIWVARCW